MTTRNVQLEPDAGVGENCATLTLWMPEMPQPLRGRILSMLVDGPIMIREYTEEDTVIGYALSHERIGYGTTHNGFSTLKFYTHWLIMDDHALCDAHAWARATSDAR